MKVVDGLDVPKHDLVLRSTRIIIDGKEIQNYAMLLFKTWKQFRVHSAVFTGKDKNVEEWGKRSVKYDVSLRFIFSQHEKNELSEEHIEKTFLDRRLWEYIPPMHLTSCLYRDPNFSKVVLTKQHSSLVNKTLIFFA